MLHTHAFDAAYATPYLRIVSAAPESGKTLLMEVLAAVCRRGWHAINPSLAVLFRKVDAESPTLLIDEMDNYSLDERRDALSVLNSGYKRGAKVGRCTERGDLKEFNCFSPKAFAGLDKRQMADTLLSRSITIRMERKAKGERRDMWIAPLVEEESRQLRERCAVWGAQHVDALRGHRPDLLDLQNRRAEVWWALLSIGELAEGDWTTRARNAARVLASGGDATDEQSEQVQLLADIRTVFGDRDALFTRQLLAGLNELDESPGGAKRRGEGLDARGLSTLLRPFKIRPRTVRVRDEEYTSRGYHLDQFADAFAR